MTESQLSTRQGDEDGAREAWPACAPSDEALEALGALTAAAMTTLRGVNC